MIDANRLAKAAAGATAVSQATTYTNDAYGSVLASSAFLEAKAPIAGRVLWVTPGFYNAIKKEITRLFTLMATTISLSAVALSANSTVSQ